LGPTQKDHVDGNYYTLFSHLMATKKATWLPRPRLDQYLLEWLWLVGARWICGIREV